MLIITEGQIIEVHLASSSLSGPEDTWAAFYVLESTLLPDASLSLLVRFLGVEVDVLAETSADEFNPGPKRLHLCISRPCVDPSDEPKLHVTKIRVWAEADFVQAQLYVKDTMLKMIPAWQKLIKSGRGKGAKPGESGKETKEPQKKRRGDGQAKPKATPKRGGPPRKRRDPKADTPKERGATDKKGMTEEKKAELRARLRKARSDLLKAGDPTIDVSDVEDSPSHGSEAEESESEQEVFNPTSTRRMSNAKEKKKKRRRDKGTTRGNRGAGLTPGTLLSRMKTPLAIGGQAEDPAELEAENDGTSRSWRTQLALKAVEQAHLGTKKKKGKKSKSPTKRISKLLAKVLSSRSESSTKKKKKKKRKRTLKNGAIESCSTSSSSYSEESIEEKSEEELEAPLRRRSKERP